jgi:hypothetical protein
MNTFEYQDIKLHIPDEKDITFTQFLNYLKVISNINDYDNDYLLYAYEALCDWDSGILQEIPVNKLNNLLESIYFDPNALQTQYHSNGNEILDIRKQKFMFRDINGLNDMTNAERTSIGTLIKQIQDITELYPLIVAILCRPTRKVVDKMTGEEYTYQEKLDKMTLNDVDLFDALKGRGKYISDNIDYKTGCKILSFFLNGIDSSVKSMVDLPKESKQNKKQTQE